MASRIGRRATLVSDRIIVGLLLALTAVTYTQFQFWNQPVYGDPAIWDYMTQVVVRGGVIYRDAVDFKSPLAAYIGAAAVFLTQPFGLPDIFAIRLVHLLMGGLTVALTYELGKLYFDSRRVALLAALLLLSFNSFGLFNSQGTEPKTATIVFGLLTLRAIRRDRPLLAGASGMLAALAWQPGLLFVGTAGLAFSRYLTSWRDGRALKVILGAAVPLLALIAYYAAVGALRDLYIWTIDFNFALHGPRGMEAGQTLVGRLPTIMREHFERERPLFVLGPLGLAATLAAALRRAWHSQGRSLLDDSARQAVLVAPLVYLAFCFINVQGGRDFILFLPFVAAFSALVIVWAVDAVAALVRRGGATDAPGLVSSGGFVTACLIVLVVGVGDAFSYTLPPPSLQDEQQEFAGYLARLGPDDAVFTHDVAGLLVLSHRLNASKYFFLHRNLQGFIDQVEPDGFRGQLNAIKAQRPALVALGEREMAYNEAIENWLHQEYVTRRGKIYRYYVRKDLAP